MEKMIKKLKYAAAVVAGMFTLGAQAETYYLRHLDNYQADPGSTSSMTGKDKDTSTKCAGWGDSPDAATASATKMETGNTYVLLGQMWYQYNTGKTYDERNSADLRTPTGDHSIPDGVQLVFQGGRINLKNGNGKTLTIPNLTVKPAITQSGFNVGDDNTTVTLQGTNWDVEAGAILGFNVTAEAGSTSNPRALDIQSTIVGTGTLLFYSNPEFLSYQNKLKNTSTFYLNGDFSGFTGAYEFLGNDKFTAVVKDAKSFAGINTPKVVLNSVLRETASVGIKLSFECDVTTGSNCSWDFGTDTFSTTVPAADVTSGDDKNPEGKSFSGRYQKTITAATTPATIDVASGKTLKIEGPIAGEIGLKKTGSGTLVLACPCFAEPITFTGTQTIDAETLSEYAAETWKWVEEQRNVDVGDPIFGLDGACIANDGESATFETSVTNLPANTVVKLRYSTDKEAWTETEIAFDAPGTVTNTISGFAPETTYYYTFTATDGTRTLTKGLRSFTTIGSAAVSPVLSLSADRRVVTAEGAISAAGAGTLSVTLYAQLDGETWTALTSTPAEAGAFALTYDLREVADFGVSVPFKAVVINTSPSGAKAWTNATAVAAHAFEDLTTYTWTGASATTPKRWADVANWSNDAAGADCQGYPVNGATAVFPSGANEVLLDRSVNLAKLDLSAKDATIVLRGVNGAAITATALDLGVTAATDFGLSSWNSSVTFDALAVTTSASLFVPQGGELVVDNGASLTCAGLIMYSTSSSCIYSGRFTVRNGSTMRTTGGFIGGGDVVVTIDNATFTCAGNWDFNTKNSGYTPLGATTVFKGAHPLLTIGGSCVPNNNYNYYVGGEFVFEIPAGGYAEAPVQMSGKYHFLDNTPLGGQTRIKVDPASAAFADANTFTQPLVQQRNTGSYYTRYAPVDWQPLRDPNAKFVCSAQRHNAAEITWTPVGAFSGNAFQLGVSIPGSYAGDAPVPAPIVGGGMPGLNAVRVAAYDANGAYVPTAAEVNAGDASLRADYANASLPARSACVYVGYIYLARGAYYFWASYDDCLRLDIDGAQVVKSENAAKSGTYKCTTTGWYPLRLYLANNSGNGGPKEIPGFYYRDLQQDNASRFLADLGDGTLLRTQLPTVTNAVTVTTLKQYPAGSVATLTRTGDLKRANVYANGTKVGVFAANAATMTTEVLRFTEAPEALEYRVVPVNGDGTEYLLGAISVTVDPATAVAAASTATCELVETGATFARFLITVSPSGKTQEVVIDALAPGSTGTQTVSATIDGEEFTFADQPYTTLAIPAAAPTSTGASVKRLGANTFVYTFLGDGTITIPEGAQNLRALVVAGGGAGGRSAGGGGGAGGMIDTTETGLTAGIYTITVGKGGEPTFGDVKTTHSTNGGDSSISDAQGVPVLRAIGGGAGGNGTDGSTGYVGNAGGSGGGYNRINTTVAAGTDGQGFAGGKGLSNKSDCSGGGGGAGAAGGDAAATAGGNGGAGKASDITGETVWYAGGGGGSANAATSTFGTGGQGGGGSASYYVPAEDGVDGLGGGGAGGSSYAGAYFGGKGGSGVVIIRFDLAPGDSALQVAPILDVTGDELVKGGYSLAIDYELKYLGTEATSVDLEILYGFTPDDLSMHQSLATGAKAGGRAVFTALMPGRTYYYAVKATNDRGFANTENLVVRKVTLKPLVEAATTLAGDLPGVWQAQFDGAAAFENDVMSSPTRRRELGPVMGFIYGDPANGEVAYTSELDGVKSYWDSARTFGYQGVIYLEGGQSYAFGAYCDDYARIVVNGETVVDQSVGTALRSHPITVAKTGWYPIELWIGNATGGAGCRSTWGARFSFAYTANPNAGFNNSDGAVSSDHWGQIRDYADGGSLLRLAPPGRGIEAVETADKTYRISLGEAEEGHEYQLLACFGAGYGGEVPEDWEHLETWMPWNGEVTLEGLNADTRFVRFFTRDLTTGETAGAATILLTAALKAPSLGEVTATADAGGNSATLVGTATDATTVTVYYRGANDLADSSVTVEVAADGSWTAHLTGLATGTDYTYSVVAANANGGTDRLTAQTLSTPGAGAFGSVKPYNNTGKRIRFHYGVTALGAGANTMTLQVGRYRNNESMGRDTSVAYSTVVVSNVTTCGEKDLVWDTADSDFTWGDVVSWKLTLASTAVDGTAYAQTVTASATPTDAAPILQLYDPNTYTWTGASASMPKRWCDPANWQSDGTVNEATLPGYPDHGAKALFDTPATVALDRTVEINALTLAAGTAEATNAVKIVGTDAETSVITMMKPASPNTANGAYGFNNFTRLELDALTLTCDGSGSEGITLAADSALVLDHRAVLVLANGKSFFCEQNNTRFELHDDSAAFFGNLLIDHANAWVALDDGHITLSHEGNSYGYACINADYDSKWKSDDCGIVFSGDHPELICGRLWAQGSMSYKDPVTQQTSSTGHLRFLVPAGGYRHSPIREKGVGNSVFSSSGALKLEVLPESPCFAAAGTTVTRLVDWPYKGITGTAANKTVVLPEGCSSAWQNLYASPTVANSTLVVTLPGAGEAGSAPAPSPVPESWEYGPYTVYKFTNVNETAYFTLDEQSEVEVLLVGGGGAGGWGQQGNSNTYGGGGGGAGGVVSKTLSLEAGVYPIRVGRGGMTYPSAYWAAPLNENGLDSTAFGLVAYGGGAGGTCEKFSDGGGRYGQNGGSCGGNTKNVDGGQAGGVAGQGNKGGVGKPNNRANGGGGAGAAAANVTTSTSNGIGGDGRACDITGVEVIYGGGGGAGSGSSWWAGGIGGAGGGGRGLNWNDPNLVGVNGVDGLGGGGGGGAQDADRGNGPYALTHTCTRPGGRGGNGVVIVRVKTGDRTTALREAIPTVGGAVIRYEDLSTTPSTDREVVLTGLGFGVATNYTLNGETIAFTTLAENPGVADSLPGLFEAHFAGTQWTSDIIAAAAGHRELGPIAANNNKGWCSTTDPARYCNWSVADTFAYCGYMFMEQGKTYYFGGYFDNKFRVYVDNTKFWETSNGNDFQRKGFTPPQTGWYAVDFRFYHSSGNQGAKGNFAKGLVYTTDPDLYSIANAAGNSAYSTGWEELLDPGDGSLFRTVPPVDRILRPQGVMRDAAGTGLMGSLVSEAAIGALGTPDLDVWAVTGETYLEGATTNDWVAAGGQLVHIGAFAIDAASLSFKLENLGAANYVRFVGFYTDAFGEHATWSESVHLPSVTEQVDAMPVVSVAAVSTDAISAEIAVDVLYAGGETCAVTVKYGVKPDALTKSAVILTGVGEGQSAGVLGGLMPSHTYYAAICATGAGATSADSEVFAFSTAAEIVEPRGTLADAFERTVEIVATNFTGDVATSLTVRVGPGETVAPLVALVGKRNSALDEAEWDRTVAVAASVPVEGGTYVYQLGENWGVSDFALVFAVGEDIRFTAPFDAQVEYIQSTGSEWIDTGISGKPSTKVTLDVQYTEKVNQARILAASEDSDLGGLSLAIYINGSGKWASAMQNGKGDWVDSGVTADTARHTFVLDGPDSGRFFIDGALKTTRTNSRTKETIRNLGIFCDNRKAGQGNFAKARLYALTIEEAGEGVRDFYPVRKDGKGCLYDAVSGELYGNAAATGDFLTGADVATTAPLKTSALGASAVYYWTDPTAPRVVSAETTELASGCQVTIAGTAANAVGATVTVGETVVPAIFAEGAFTATVTGLTPGATYTWFVTVTNAVGEIDSTPAKSFTLPGAAVLSPVTTVSRNQRHITLTGTLTTVGAGTNTVTLLMGTTTSNLEPVDCKLVYNLADYDTLTPSQSFTLEYDLAAFGGSYYFGVRVENACFTSEAGSWTKEVANTTQVKVNDDATYTWVGNEPHDSTPTPFTYTWTNPANWNCSSADRWDYPANSAKVAFPAGTATVDLDTSVTLASWTIGEGAEVSIVSANGSTLTVSGHWKQEKIAVVTLGDGLNAVFSGDVGIAADGAELVVSNATLTATANGVFFDQGGVLRIAGERPLVTAKRFRTYAGATADGSVVFTVPANGYASAPIQGASQIENIGTGGGRNVVFSVDPASPACHVDSNLNVPLLGWSGSYGIDMGKIAFADDWPDNDVDYGLASESATGPWYPFATWTGEAASTHGFGAHIEGTLDGRPILRYPEAVAIGPDSVTLRMKVVPGAGTDGVSLKAVVWPTLVGESAAVTNDIAFVTAADDAYLFTLTGLEPETAYRVQVVGTSTLGGTQLVATSPVFGFTTAEVDESSYYPSVAYVADSAVANGDMTFTFDWQYINPGYSATGCAFTLEYWHDGLTNSVALAGIDIPQQIRTVTPPLKPNTTYGFRVKAVNDLDPARVSYTAEQTLATDEEGLGSMQKPVDAGAWVTGNNWATFTPAEDNLIRGKMPYRYENKYQDGSSNSDGAATDGEIVRNSSSNQGKNFGVGNNCVAGWTLDEPSSISELRFYTVNWGNRDQIKIDHITATVNGEEVTISPASVNQAGGAAYAYLRASEDMALVNEATAVTVYFGAGQQSSGVHYGEIEVIGEPSGFAASLTVEDYTFDGSALQAAISREGEKQSDVYACFGATYGGDSTNGWANVVKLGASFREGVKNLTVATVVPAGTAYVRFVSERDGWSESLYVGELEITADPQVKLAALTLVETNIAEAALSVDLNGLGTGAEGVDLFAVYGHGDFTYTNQIAAGATTLGTIPFTLPNLKPNTPYQVYVFATNGLAGGYAETAPIAFATTEEESYGAIRIELPAGYTRLDYVESNGKQWVDTGVKPTAAGDYSIVMDFRIANYSGTTALFGTDWGWNGTWLLETYNSDLNFDPGEHINGKTAGVDQRFTIDGDGVTMVNLETGASTTTTGFTRGNAAKNLGLFAVNGGNYASTFRLYRWQAFAAGELVRDFVPCKDANGVACLYDLVSKTPSYSKTSTALIAGPDYSGVDPCEMLGTDSVIWDGTVLTAVLSREGTEESDLYACYGATYGGAETNGWENVVKVGAFPAEVAKTPGVIVPTGARYVRFFSAKDGWSEAIFLPETPVTVSEQPIFGVTAVKTVRETSARFLGYLAALGEGASSVEVIAEYGTMEGMYSSEQIVRTISTDAFDPSESLDLDLLGLTPNMHYYVRFKAVNDRGVESALTEAFEIDTIARGTIGATVDDPGTTDETVAVQCETRDLETGERVIIFSATSVNNTDTPEPAVFRVTTPGYAEVLVVGGGGAGGCYTSQTGGGGGAGGFQYFESMYFAPGDYLMAVGPGAIARGENGPSGRKSTITLGSTVLVEALGGDGGRRQNNDGTQTKSGVSSGGGKVGYHTWVNLGTPGQGNNGGNGCKDSTFGGSGGGGAGAPGGDALIIDDVKTCGNGGDGLPCAITGETLYYAGGGGGAGAGNDVVSGRGGLGGGGSGTSGNTTESIGNRAARNAVNGLGGGGGAGGNSANPPGNGGSGTIILRFVPEDSTLAEHPVAQLNAITPKNDANDVPGVDVSYRIVSEGAGKLVTVDFEYGTDINSFHSVRFSDGAFVENYEDNFTGLRANVTYYGRMKVTDEEGTVSYSRVLKFTTLEGDDSAIDQTAPRFGEITYGTTNQHHKVEITAAGTNFLLTAGETTVKLLVGTDPIALAEVPVTVVSLTDEAVTVFCDAVDFDTPYYGALVVDNGDFLTQSPVLAFTVSGASVLLSSAASASADSQRTLIFSGVIKALGAGETTAKLYLSTANASSLELAQTIAVTATGYFEFAPVTFEWDQTAYYRIDVENSFQDKKWTSAGTAGNKGVYDYAGYRWIPADDDGVHLWTDAANWEQTTDHAPGKGYPSGNAGNNGSVAYFPAMGYEYVVDVNGGNVASANVIPSENARIRFRSATGNGWSGIVNGKFSWAKNESMVFDGFSATLGQNTSSSLTTSNSFALVNGSLFRTGNYSDFQMNATGIAVYVDPTSQLGPFVRANNTVATVGGTDAEVILEGRWLIGVINVFGSGTTLGKGVIFRGSKAQMTMDHANARLRGTATNTAEAPSMPFVFEVPVDGYENVPVSSTRTDHGLLFDSGTVTLKVSADSPAALAETDGVYPLVSAVNGINPEGFLLGDLPHPDTDSWILTYDNTDATTGTLLTGIGVRLVGYPSEPTAPVVRILHVKESTADSVTFAADFRCGGTSPSATWSYWLDDETAAQARTIGTFTGVENFEEFSVDGLEKGTQHVLHLKGVSAGGESVVDYDFGTVGDWAVLGAVEGVAAEPYGPYTQLIADAETEGVFKVLVACAAEISFDDGEAEAFTLNTGTYTVKGGALANEAGTIAELDGAETLTIKVLTRAVENEPLIDVVTAPTALGDSVTIPLTVLGLGGELTRAPDNPVTAVAAKLVWGYHPEHLVYTNDLGTVGLDAVEAGVTNLAITTLPSDTFFYAKVIADNGEADGIGMSHLFTFQTPAGGMPVYDPSAPVISSAVADVSQGDRMTVTCAAEGAETFSMLIGGDASMGGWAEVEVEVEGEERTLTLGNLTPGTNFWWQLVARSAASVCVATVPQQAVMPAASSFMSGPTVTTAQDALTVKGSAKLGAGETWVLGAFTVGGVTTTVVLGCWTNGVDKQISSFDWTHTFSNAWNEAVGYSITLSNGVDGVSWTSEPVAGEKTLADTATYTWTATGDAGAAWNDPANWQCSAATGIGYPTETSTAKFDAADGADVVLDQNRTVKTFTVGAGARVVFSGPFTFTAPGTGEWNFNLAGVTLGAKDGATFRHAGTFFATAENQTFLADNATLHFNNFYTCKDAGKSTANCTIRLSGKAPLFLSQGGFGPRQSSADYTFVLNVPERGWTEPVIRSNGLTKQVKFGATDQSTARTTKFRFAIDPDSPFFSSGGIMNTVIVDWPYGFSAENLDFEHVEKPKRARKCEFSLNAEDPAAATLLKLRLTGYGLVFFIK